MSGKHAAGISVGVTVYNQAAFIAGTLASVFSQTSPADDIVVVDDGSSDNTPAVLAQFATRVRVIRQANQGVAAARNRAVAESSGDYVALLDGDDIWLPTKLARCRDAIRAHPDAVIIAHDVDLVSAELATILEAAPLLNHLPDPQGGQLEGAWVFDQLMRGCFIRTTSQVVVKRQTYLELGGSNPIFPVGSDYDLYLRASLRAPFVLIPEVLARWRQHDASASGRSTHRMANWSTERAKVLRRLASTLDPEHAATARAAAAAAVDEAIYHLYHQVPSAGRSVNAGRLLKLAVHCQHPRSLLLAAAAVMPAWLRDSVRGVLPKSVDRGRG